MVKNREKLKRRKQCGLCIAFLGFLSLALALLWPYYASTLRDFCPWVERMMDSPVCPLIGKAVKPSSFFKPKSDLSLSNTPIPEAIIREKDLEVEKILPTLPWMSPEELARHDGSDASLPLLLAFGGEIFDVTNGSDFYKKGAPYNVFTGNHYTRALVLQSLNAEDLTNDLSDLSVDRLRDFRETQYFYRNRYALVARLLQDT
eukprot:g4904.t1